MPHAEQVPAVVEPVPPDTARLLRQAVLALATGERRRRFPAVLHVGIPGEAATEVVDDRGWDAGLRADVAGALLRAVSGATTTAWLSRPGTLELQDVDADWLGPLVRSAEENDVDLTYVVVTRHGWIDPRTGVNRTWRRIRDRRSA
jgi:hypothetical protein